MDADWHRFGLVLEDHPLNLHARRAEVDEKPNLDARRLQVVQQLRFVSAVQGDRRFDLAKHSIIDEQVGEVRAYGMTFILDAERHFCT